MTNENENIGSATAREFLLGVIDNTDFVSVAINAASNLSAVPLGSNDIWLSPSQINSFINGSVNVDNRTLGWGMTFMHELNHTQVGGGLRDTPGNPGPLVSQMNIIRFELNTLGGNYGQRLDYQASGIGGNAYLPFNVPAKQSTILWIPPSRVRSDHKYVRF